MGSLGEQGGHLVNCHAAAKFCVISCDNEFEVFCVIFLVQSVKGFGVLFTIDCLHTLCNKFTNKTVSSDSHLAQKRTGYLYPPIVTRSSEDVTILEFTCDVVVTNEPRKVLLMYTVSHTIAEAVDESIQARFGGVGLPTTIEDLEEVVTHSGNVVAVQVYTGLVRFGAIRNTGVAVCPVAVVSNCSVHQGFDLTHEMVSFG